MIDMNTFRSFYQCEFRWAVSSVASMIATKKSGYSYGIFESEICTVSSNNVEHMQLNFHLTRQNPVLSAVIE